MAPNTTAICGTFPAGHMSALPEAPDHFLRGARANYGQSVQATILLPRPHCGRYVSSLLKEAAGPGGIENLRWIQGKVTSFAARAVSCDRSVERRQHAGYKNRGARSG